MVGLTPNDAHSIYFLMIPKLLVTSHTDLELYGFDVNYIPAISKYSITCISLMKKMVVVGLTPKQCTFCVCSDVFVEEIRVIEFYPDLRPS